MRTLYSLLAILLLGSNSFGVLADVQTVGEDYRTMFFNYHMIAAITEKCPKVEVTSIEPRSTVESLLQKKLGMELYVQTMIKLQKSRIRSDAFATAEQLWEKLNGCDDPRLQQGIDRLVSAHAQAFERFKKAPALVKPKPVPIPMRQQ